MSITTNDVFRHPRVRGLLLLQIPIWLGLASGMVLHETLNWSAISITDPVITPLSYLFIFGTSSLWIIGRYRQRHIALRRLWGPWPNSNTWRSAIGLLATLFMFSLGTFQVSYTLASFWFPQRVESVLQESIFLSPEDTVVPGLYNALIFGILVVGAPVFEELLFRTFLLHRWGSRWTLAIAVVLSSLIFGLLHSNIIGLSVFGLVMALLYLRSNSLALVIAIHSLNNGCAVVLELTTDRLGERNAPTLEAFQANVWLGVVCVLISTPFLIRFVRQNWQVLQAPLPYFANGKHWPDPQGRESVKRD